MKKRHKRLPEHLGLATLCSLALTLASGAAMARAAVMRQAQLPTERTSGAAALRARQHQLAEELKRRARAGNVAAELRLAELYYYGIGTHPDARRVLRWYQRAARQGSARAELRLGDLYHYGLLVSPNQKRANKYYQRALAELRARAALHRQQAPYALGMAALVGRGRQANPRRALHWLHLAAHQNNVAAELELGVLRVYGLAGIAADPARARYWFRQAARRGSATAAYTLSWLYSNGVGTSTNLSKADHWLQRAMKLETPPGSP